MEKVVVGMSGGVDSSVAAYLLQKEGYEVLGVTMKMWNEEGCLAASAAVTDARHVADYLGIKHETLEFGEQFKECIVQNFIEEYYQCRTPNPCVRCNRYLKWEALLDWARTHGANKIATGHYARICHTPDGRLAVRLASNATKDQTYALYRLTQEQLASTLMPIGKYEKREVRELAREAGIPVFDKPDSQDICFIPDGNYASFIQRNSAVVTATLGQDGFREGNFVLTDGTVLGKHKGLVHYTIGQRKGLGIAYGEPVFVTQLKPETNEVVLGTNADVFAQALIAGELNWMGIEGAEEELHCLAKIRYAHKGSLCTVKRVRDNQVKVIFIEPQRAITPGQSVVFYSMDGEEERYVLGGGIIQRACDAKE